MDIDKKGRTELKAYFVKNAIPTESNFAELIDGALNQKDDGVVKLAGNPLSIEAAGDAAGEKKAIHFYDSFADAGPAWVLSLNPRSDPADPATARAGFSISDAAGNSRLFIDRSSGNVSIPQEDWIPAELVNNWVNVLLSFNPCAYFKDSMGVVHLRGVVKNGASGQAAIFTLPPGYRPAHEEVHMASASNAVGTVRVYPTGMVSLIVGSNTFLSLDGITFRVA